MQDSHPELDPSAIGSLLVLDPLFRPSLSTHTLCFGIIIINLQPIFMFVIRLTLEIRIMRRREVGFI